MVSRTVLIQRPVQDLQDVTAFILLANNFKSIIRLSSGTSKVNAKSTLGVISLHIEAESAITIQADGADESEAIEALSAFLL